MGEYTKAKSKFVKGKIKKCSWKDSGYIDDLLFLEGVITGDIGMGWTVSIKYNSLKNSYKKEYGEIYIELNPKEFEEIKKREAKELADDKREEAEWEKEEELEKKRAKKNWVKAGGKL